MATSLPAERLAPAVVAEIFSAIVRVRDSGTTVLMVEQNTEEALGIANRGYVLENGRIVLHDTAPALLANPQVQQAYLGL